MQLVKEELPLPGPGAVTVEVEAVGLNFADIFAIWGLYGATPEGIFTPGLEYAGRVVKVGPEKEGEAETKWKVGDRVMGVTRFGGYATHLNIDSRYILPLPAEWSFAEGAAYLVQVLTAYYGLKELGNMQPGQTVLIHSAAGGVGTHAGRIARKFGCYTIGTIGSEQKIDYLRREGYDAWIVRNPRTFRADLLHALDGRPLNIIMECIGGKIFSIGFELLAQQGRHVVYGSARYGQTGNRPNYLKLLWQFLTRPKIDPQKLPEANKAVMGFNLIYLYEKADLMHQLLQELDALQLPKPVVGHIFPFERLPDAIRKFQTGETMGKVVVETGKSLS